MNLNRFNPVPIWALLTAFVISIGTGNAATYRVGDTVEDFTFVARREFTRADGAVIPAGSVVRLTDFAGSIVFLEWFAVWCPFCVAAAPQVERGIVRHYEERRGNPSGAPVIHVAVNQEQRAVYQPLTDRFVTEQRFGITVNDYDNTSVNRVRFLFQSGGQPIFVVINGLTNSPTHRPWELLVNHLGYGQTNFDDELANFRAVIDSVRASPTPPQVSSPRRTPAGFEFVVTGQPGASYRVEATTDLKNWSGAGTVTGSAGGTVFVDQDASPLQRFYRVVAP